MIYMNDIMVWGFDGMIQAARLSGWLPKDGDSKWDFGTLNDNTKMVERVEFWNSLESTPYQYRIGESDMDELSIIFDFDDIWEKLLKMVHVKMRLKAPMSFWSELQPFLKDSSYIMEDQRFKIITNPFEMEDFDWQRHVYWTGQNVVDSALAEDADGEYLGESGGVSMQDMPETIIKALNLLLEFRSECAVSIWKEPDGSIFRQIDDLTTAIEDMLPSSYFIEGCVDTDYATLRKIFRDRKDMAEHNMKEFISKFRHLPYSELLFMNVDKEDFSSWGFDR